VRRNAKGQPALQGTGTVRPHLSFSGHETFVFRYAWLKKAVDAVATDPGIFTRESAIVTLGVGKNMVRSMRHWALATQVIEEAPRTRGNQLVVTHFGAFLFGEGGRDPYLEDPNTLWLLHWRLFAQQQRCTIWHWTFNKLPSNEFTRETLFDFVQSEIHQRGAVPPSDGVLKRDIEVFIRTCLPTKATKNSVLEDSLDCPLVELQLMEQTGRQGHFRLRRGPKPSLSDFTFAYCLADFWQRNAPSQETFSLSDVAFRPGSPGSVFKLDENSLIERIERLDDITRGVLRYSETAGLRQVYRGPDLNAVQFLAHYYDSTLVPAEIGG